MMVCTRLCARNILGVLLAFSFLLGLSQQAFAQSPTLEELDRILLEAGSVRNFLNDKNAQAKYYQVLAGYIGEDKIPRADFDAHIEDMKKVLTAAPELEQRLWSTQGLGQTHQIELSVKSSGLDLKVQQWNDALKNWQEALAKQRGSLADTSDLKNPEHIKTLQTRMDALAEELKKFSPPSRQQSPTSASKSRFL